MGGQVGRWARYEDLVYHVKEIIFDSRVHFTGSANFTVASHNNQERGYKMTGDVVAKARADISSDKSRAQNWLS